MMKSIRLLVRIQDYKDYKLVVAEDGAVLEIHIPYDEDDKDEDRNPSLNPDTDNKKSIKVVPCCRCCWQIH